MAISLFKRPYTVLTNGVNVKPAVIDYDGFYGVSVVYSVILFYALKFGTDRINELVKAMLVK
jgi:hypothetical protein